MVSPLCMLTVLCENRTLVCGRFNVIPVLLVEVNPLRKLTTGRMSIVMCPSPPMRGRTDRRTPTLISSDVIVGPVWLDTIDDTYLMSSPTKISDSRPSIASRFGREIRLFLLAIASSEAVTLPNEPPLKPNRPVIELAGAWLPLMPPCDWFKLIVLTVPPVSRLQLMPS